MSDLGENSVTAIRCAPTVWFAVEELRKNFQNPQFWKAVDASLGEANQFKLLLTQLLTDATVRMEDLRSALDGLVNHAIPDNWNDSDLGPSHTEAWRRALQVLGDQRANEPVFCNKSRRGKN